MGHPMQNHDQAAGKLYLVGTPIGNLEDMTFRAVRILREVDFIAAEDTRHTRKLLTHFDIAGKDLFSYHEHNERMAARHIMERVLRGEQGAVVSDAGMPGISDPGQEVVQLAIEKGIDVIVVPGPSAGITALCGSGLATGSFSFYGFLPREVNARKQVLEALRHRKETMIFYEAPHRIDKTLQALYEAFGERFVVIARELTKLHEDFIRGVLSKEGVDFDTSPRKGEMVIIVQGTEITSEEPTTNILLPIVDHVQMMVNQGVDRKEAMREVAKLHGLSRRDVYQMLLEADESQQATD